MLSIVLVVSTLCLWIYHHFGLHFPKDFPPGPLLPVPLLPFLPWSKYFGMSQLSLFEELKKDYGSTFRYSLCTGGRQWGGSATVHAQSAYAGEREKTHLVATLFYLLLFSLLSDSTLTVLFPLEITNPF